MKKLLIAFILFLLSTTAHAQIFSPPLGLQDEDDPIERPINVIKCSGVGISCEKSGTTGVLTVSGGGSGSMTTVKEADSQVGGADIVTLDFGAGFDLAESPDTEVQISLDLTEYTFPAGVITNNAVLGEDINWLSADQLVQSANVNWANIETLAPINSAAVNWTDMIDLTTGGAVVWGNIAEGELADSTVVSADIKDGTVTAADTAITAGRSLTWSTNEINADAELYTSTISFVLESPADADAFLIWKAPHAITITDIDCIVGAATSAVIDIQECGSDGTSCSTVDAAITCDADGAADDGSLSNAGIDAGDWLKLDIGTVTGTVKHVSGTITYTKND